MGPWSATNGDVTADDDGSVTAEPSVFVSAVMTTDEGIVISHDHGGRGGGLLTGDMTCEGPFSIECGADHGDDDLRAAWRDTEAHDKLDKLDTQVSRRGCLCVFLVVRLHSVWFGLEATQTFPSRTLKLVILILFSLAVQLAALLAAKAAKKQQQQSRRPRRDGDDDDDDDRPPRRMNINLFPPPVTDVVPPAPAAAAPPVDDGSVGDPAEKWRKMLRLGVPRAAVLARMAAAGIANPEALLGGGDDPGGGDSGTAAAASAKAAAFAAAATGAAAAVSGAGSGASGKAGMMAEASAAPMIS